VTVAAPPPAAAARLPRKLDLGARGSDGVAMPDRRERKRRVAAPRMSYTTRVHMKRRFAAIDFRFLAAVIALAIAAVLIVRYF
jgi:hypothetical protein